MKNKFSKSGLSWLLIILMPVIFALGCNQAEEPDPDPHENPGDQVVGHVEEMLMQNLFIFTAGQRLRSAEI